MGLTTSCLCCGVVLPPTPPLHPPLTRRQRLSLTFSGIPPEPSTVWMLKSYWSAVRVSGSGFDPILWIGNRRHRQVA